MYGVSIILVSGYPSVSSTEIFTTADRLQHKNELTMQVHQFISLSALPAIVEQISVFFFYCFYMCV